MAKLKDMSDSFRGDCVVCPRCKKSYRKVLKDCPDCGGELIEAKLEIHRSYEDYDVDERQR